MSDNRNGAILAGVVLAVMVAACGDLSPTEETSAAENERAQQPVVVPAFELEGLGEVPERMVLESLGLTVADVILTPVGSRSGVDYSTRRPIVLGFDVDEGDRVQHGRRVRLPHSGAFEVSLRIDHAEGERTPEGTGCDATEQFAVCMSGLIRGRGISGAVATTAQEKNDGDPIPLPFIEFNAGSGQQDAGRGVVPPERWAAFSYRSQQTHTFEVDRVRVVGGEQYLKFEFDVAEWASEIAEPVSEAIRTRVESGEWPTQTPETGETSSVPTFDVTKEVDKIGEGRDALGEHMDVRSRRRGPAEGQR